MVDVVIVEPVCFQPQCTQFHTMQHTRQQQPRTGAIVFVMGDEHTSWLQLD